MTWIVMIVAVGLGFFAERSLHKPSKVTPKKVSPPVANVPTADPNGATANSPRPSLDTVLGASRFELRPVLARFLTQASAEELESLAEHWGPKMDTDYVSSLCWRMLLARWVDLDPMRALAVEKATGTSRLRGWCYRIWSERAPLAALNSAQEEEDPPYVLTRIVAEVAKKHLEEVLLLIDAYPHEGGLLRAIFSEWARIEPDKALARIDTLSGSVREDIRKTILAAIASESPEGALAIVRESESQTITQRNQESAILRSMIEDDPLKATPHVLAMSPCKKRFDLIRRLARARATNDPEGTLAWGKTLASGSEKQAIIATAVSKLDLDLKEVTALLDEIGWQYASTNPQDKVEVQHSSGGSSSSNTDGSLIVSLENALKKASSEEDLPAVMAALGKLQDNRSKTIRKLAEVWLYESPGFLQSVLSTLPDRRLAASTIGSIANAVQDEGSLQMMAETLDTFTPEQRSYPFRSLADKYAELDAGAAIKWATTLADEREKNHALAVGIAAMSQEDPQAAIATLENFPNYGARQESVTAITRALVATDVPQARNWIESLPETDVSALTYQEMTQGWFNKDPLAVSEWVGQLPSGVHRDGAIRALTRSLTHGSRTDFEAAEAWAESMTHDEHQQNLGSVYLAWLAHDRAAALEALSGSSLAESHKEAIRSR